jgi:hypothetical protein
MPPTSTPLTILFCSEPMAYINLDIFMHDSIHSTTAQATKTLFLHNQHPSFVFANDDTSNLNKFMRKLNNLIVYLASRYTFPLDASDASGSYYLPLHVPFTILSRYLPV